MTSGAVRVFQTTSARGLRRDLPPMRLWEKAKRHGVWNPSDLDLGRDAADWRGLAAGERDVLLRLASLFQAGEEAVTLDLLPLIGVVAAEGRLEDEMFLTAFLFEEAKHVETFRRFFDEVAGERGDLARYHGPAYRVLFYDELPAALHRLSSDPSPVAQARASVTYNMIVEGVLAETGYHAYHQILARRGILPGMQTAIGHLQRDESRHLAYGVYLLSRLVAEHGDPVWHAIEERMGELLGPAIEMIGEIFAAYGDEVPFGLRQDDFVEYAVAQFQRRLARVERARGASLAAVESEPDEV